MQGYPQINLKDLIETLGRKQRCYFDGGGNL